LSRSCGNPTAGSLTHAQQAGEKITLLGKWSTPQMVYAEELHASEVDKMLRKPSEVAAFRRVRRSA
jgi:hypothetical protein